MQTMERPFRYAAIPAIDRSKLTLRLHAQRLCCFPGNQTRWLEKDEHNEIVVKHAPVIGYVPCTRLDWVQMDDVLEALPVHYQNALAEGFPVVIQRSELPVSRRQTLCAK